MFTFYKARGLGVGSSLVEEDQLELAKKLEKMAKEKGVKVGVFLGFHFTGFYSSVGYPCVLFLSGVVVAVAGVGCCCCRRL